MYIPHHFEADAALTTTWIAQAPFATLVSADADGRPFATHLPLMLLEESRQLIGHVAKANPHWQYWERSPTALAIFHGPHAYISPSWYATTAAVPTWNYTAVHVTGTVQAVHASPDKEAMLAQLIEQTEPAFATRWASMAASIRHGMLDAIVGLTLQVERVEAKAKLSQNRSAADRAGVMDALQSGHDDARAIAALMAAIAR